jgi:hypothetical protein
MIKLEGGLHQGICETKDTTACSITNPVFLLAPSFPQKEDSNSDEIAFQINKS